MIPYKHNCSICNKVFFSISRGQNICSKSCRNSIKKIKRYRQCILCGWDATIDIHHENGKEYDFCPNHHSLLTRGKQNLDEVLKGTLYSIKKPKEYLCPIVDLGKQDLKFCPIINGSAKIQLHKVKSDFLFNNFYNKLKEANINEFCYKDIVALLNWKYEKVKKYVYTLIDCKKVIVIEKCLGGRNKSARFKLI